MPRRGKRSWPGPCPRRPILQGFAISALRAAARRLRSETRLRAQCGARFFLDAQKETKEAPGGERNRQARLRRPCLHAARPLDPPLRRPN